MKTATESAYIDQRLKAVVRGSYSSELHGRIE
jgi:hypothetical protein